MPLKAVALAVLLHLAVVKADWHFPWEHRTEFLFNPTMKTFYPCTTHVPLFIPAPTNPTLTRYSTTITGTSSIDCGGCSLTVEEIFNWGVLPTKTVKPTMTITMPTKYTLTYACQPTTRKPKGWWGDGD